MGNFIKYSDVPVFMNFMDETRAVSSSNSAHLFAASQVSINLNPTLSPNRYLGQNQNRADFSTSGPLEAKISMTFFPIIKLPSDNSTTLNIQNDNQLNFFKSTGQFQYGNAMQIGNYLFYRTYLQNYSLKINPFQPVSVTANFISYDLDNVVNTSFDKFGSAWLGITKDNSTSFFKALHGLTTTMSGTTQYLPQTKTSIQVNVDCQRTPVYNLGSKYPNTVFVTAVERTTTVEGESIGNAVTLSGVNAGSTSIYLSPLEAPTPGSITSNAISFDISGKIISQDVSVSQQGFVNGKVVIKEIIL
jgi:hypothetical protein